MKRFAALDVETLLGRNLDTWKNTRHGNSISITKAKSRLKAFFPDHSELKKKKKKCLVIEEHRISLQVFFKETDL